jgi:hypothetical protein
MIPIRDENTCRRGSAWLTWSIIAVNLLVFSLLQGFGSDTAIIRS